MALDPVVKVELTAHKTVLERLLTELQNAGLIHVDPHSVKQWESEKAEMERAGKRIAELRKEIHEVERAIGFIKNHEPKVPMLKKLSMQPDEVTREGLKDVVEQKSARELKGKCETLEQRLADVQNETRDILQKKEELLPIAELGVPLDLLAAEGRTKAFVSKLEREPYENLEKADIPSLVSLERIGGENTVYFSVAYHVEARELVDQLGKDFRFDPLSLPIEPQSPRELIDGYNRALEGLGSRKELLLEEARVLAKDAFALRYLHDYLSTELEKEIVKEQCFFTENASVLHGWIRKRDMEKTRRIVDAHREAFFAVIEKEAEELEPTVYRNNSLVSPYEVVVNLYSPPHPREVDPTPFVAPFYAIFFATCLTEGGYGIVITVLAALALVLLKPRGQMRKFINLFLSLGVASIVIGFAMGTVFGINFDVLPERLAWMREVRYKLMVFDSGKDVLTFFAFCLAVGVIHLILAYGIKFYRLVREGDWAAALCEQLPYIFLLLAPLPKILAGVRPQHKEVLNWVFLGLLGYWGGALLFFSDRTTLNPLKRIGKGLFTLYGVTSVLGDVLSYARLLALGIATGVIAGTVNILADMVKMIPIIGIVAFVPVLIFGHMFNLLTSSMSAFVHSVRLQFMEFFQKFYTGEGRLFTPFAEKRKYTLLKMQEK
jgi:V/A-type H+-transporting ATPase subunit I